MRKSLLSAFFALSFVFSFYSSASAQGVCNQRCEVDQDCGQSYRCYVGVCRAQSCPSSNSCSCAGAALLTPSTTPTAPLITRPTAVPTFSPKPPSVATAMPSQIPTATPFVGTGSGALTQTPKTGFGAVELTFLAFGLFLLGTFIANTDKIGSRDKISPFELRAKRAKQKSSIR